MQRVVVGSSRFSVLGALAVLAARLAPGNVVRSAAADRPTYLYARTSPRKNAGRIVSFLPPPAGSVRYAKKPHLKRLGLRAWAGRL